MIRKGWTVSGVFGLKGWLMSVLFSLWMETIGGISIQLIPQDPVVNQSVTLSVTGFTGDIRTFTWFKGPKTNAADQILAYFPFSSPPSQTPGPRYFPRASGLPNGSLQITNVQLTDQGIYTVIVQTDTIQLASVNLTVYDGPEDEAVTESSDVSCAAVIVGIVCGTVLGVIMIISLSFLLYKRFLGPVNNGQSGSSADRQNPSADYCNTVLAGKSNTAKEDSCYTDLQFRSQDMYSSLRR